MKQSANLNIITKAIEKASHKTGRDLIELEILQSNPNSAVKFANSCYLRTKEALIQDLSKMRPEYNIIFSDGTKINNQENAEYQYVIFAVDGLNNLSRSLADCSIAISLQYQNESIATAIYKISNNDLYYAEKGFGAYLNNRKIKVSRRKIEDSLLICGKNTKKIEEIGIKNYQTRNYGCKTLEIAYFSAGKVDLCHFNDANPTLNAFTLLAQEAGGTATIDNNELLLKNL